MQTIFKFEPMYKARPWGDQGIAGLGGFRKVPKGKIGEAWEITDREGDESVVSNGMFAGRSIRRLLDERGAAVMGRPWSKGRRFPLLIKILDAAERLSLQVHPPAAVAAALKGEPKTEMWYLLGTRPGAALMAGFKQGVKRAEFEQVLRHPPAGQEARAMESMVHRVQVREGDAMFIPSGRIHAIDAGCLILEIQQNSDTTYRVYDWGRAGLDGKPRQLHVEESLRSIDFNDAEPQLLSRHAENGVRRMVECGHFTAEAFSVRQPRRIGGHRAAVVHVVAGEVRATAASDSATLLQGETVLLAAVPHELKPAGGEAELAVAWVGEGN